MRKNGRNSDVDSSAYMDRICRVPARLSLQVIRCDQLSSFDSVRSAARKPPWLCRG